MEKVFEEFSEIEQDVKKNVPPILYKYRNWNDDFHKKILLDNILWLAHPHTLNDPYDIRIPYRFDVEEVNHPVFYEKLKKHFEIAHPHINPVSREFVTICENQLDIIKQDPVSFFEKNYNDIRNGKTYDIVGVFSLSKNPLDETMWAHYGNNSEGFCVGFDTIELLRNLNMAFGYVDYKEEPMLFSFLRPVEDTTEEWLYRKHTKWANEQEFRIITLNIDNDSDREISFSKEAIKEVIVGSKMPKKNFNEIVSILKSRYNSTVLLFRVAVKASEYGFQKKPLHY